MRRLKILTWHVHGAYLYYLSQLPHDILLPVKRAGGDGYYGRIPCYPWPENVIEVPAEEVKEQHLDCVIFQSRKNFLHDSREILSEEQRCRVAKIYLEHDPPREHPTDSKHVVDSKDVLIVHVTAFNRLMWDNGRSPSVVIEHGVLLPEGIQYRGQVERGVVVINNIRSRGRRLGYDVFESTRRKIPLDLIGMGWREADGIGEYPYRALFGTVSQYRFYFNPIRYTSLGLSLCEAMTIGLPVVALATTELVTVIENGRSGFIDTEPDKLVEAMSSLLADPARARRIGEEARRVALERFGIERFKRDWSRVLQAVIGGGTL